MRREDRLYFEKAPDHAESKGMGGIAADPTKDAVVAAANGATGEKNGLATTTGVTNIKEAAPMPAPSVLQNDTRVVTNDFDLAETEHHALASRCQAITGFLRERAGST